MIFSLKQNGEGNSQNLIFVDAFLFQEVGIYFLSSFLWVNFFPIVSFSRANHDGQIMARESCWEKPGSANSSEICCKDNEQYSPIPESDEAVDSVSLES